MTKEKARHPRQETAARFAESVKGTPYGKFTRKQAFALAAFGLSYVIAVVLLEGAL